MEAFFLRNKRYWRNLPAALSFFNKSASIDRRFGLATRNSRAATNVGFATVVLKKVAAQRPSQLLRVGDQTV